jgi:hypothetical protein
MDKGEGIMPVPQGVISTSEGPVDPVQEVVQEVVQVLDEAIAEADTEETTEEYEFDPEQV